MKHYPGLRNPFASKQTTIALQKFVFCCQEKVNSPTWKQIIKLSKVRIKCKTLNKWKYYHYVKHENFHKHEKYWKIRKYEKQENDKLLFAIWKRKNIKTWSNIENQWNIQIIENMKTQNHAKILKKKENISVTKIWVWRKPWMLLLLDPNLVKYLLWSITKKAKTCLLVFSKRIVHKG